MDLQSSPQSPAAETFVPLPALFSVFFRIGAFSFGGGLSGWVYREVVLIRPWLTEEEFLSSLAVAQILPGTNISNLAVCVGLKTRGALGVCTALAGLLLVPFFGVIGLYTLYTTVAGLDWLTAALDGVTAAAMGLLLLTAWKGGQSTVRNLSSALVFGATFLMIGILHWPLLPVVFGLGIVSVAAAWPRQERGDA